MSGSINDPNGPQTAIQLPTMRLRAAGQSVPGLKLVSITNNNYYQADRYHATIALIAGQQPDANWFSQQTDINVAFDMAIASPNPGSSGWQPLLSGMVDRLTIDPVFGTIELEGRDYSGLLIDTKTQATYQNQTSSQVATSIVGNHAQLAVGNIVATSTLVGQYYQQDHDRIQLNNFSKQTTEWDLLTYLAGLEGYDVFMTGNKLNFQPSAVEGSTPPFVIQLQPGVPTRLNVNSVKLERSLTLAKDIQVTVKSWNSKHNTSYTRVVKGTTQGGGGKSANKGDVQKYVFVKPNMTPDEALKFANKKLAELTQNERVINISMPGTLALSPRDVIKLVGTNTSFDQTYFIAEIERTMSFDGGLQQHIRAKNTSPRSQTTVQ